MFEASAMRESAAADACGSASSCGYSAGVVTASVSMSVSSS